MDSARRHHAGYLSEVQKSVLEQAEKEWDQMSKKSDKLIADASRAALEAAFDVLDFDVAKSESHAVTQLVLKASLAADDAAEPCRKKAQSQKAFFYINTGQIVCSALFARMTYQDDCSEVDPNCFGGGVLSGIVQAFQLMKMSFDLDFSADDEEPIVAGRTHARRALDILAKSTSA